MRSKNNSIHFTNEGSNTFSIDEQRETMVSNINNKNYILGQNIRAYRKIQEVIK